MKISKSHGHKNYGPIPQNEYRAANLGQNTYPGSEAANVSFPDDTVSKQRPVTMQALHPSGRSKFGDCSHSRKETVWRAEAASQQNKATGIRKHTNNARKD